MSLPEFLTEETEEAILARMLARIPSDIDTNEGSYIYDALAAVAPELAQMKINEGQFLSRGFAITTFGEYLDMRCAEHGVTRRPAVKAIGQVKFIGTVGAVVPAETVVCTTADPATNTSAIEFETVQQVTIPAGGHITSDIVAREAGENGNVAAGTINLLANPVSGITSVTNEVPTTGGVDIESDTALLVRYLARVRSPGTSGNKADYKNWAMEVSGVGDALVIPLWNGNGTVKVVLVDAEKQPASQAIVDAVQAYISPNPANGEGKAPIGASVTVVAAATVSINVTATVIRTDSKTLADINQVFESGLNEYLKAIAFSSDPTVRYVRIGSILLDTEGVQDYSSLQVNGGNSNVVIDSGQVAVKGTVTLNE